MGTIYYRLPFEMRWDQLSYLGYGDSTYTPDLVNANPQIGVYSWIPEGAIILFPIILGAAISPTLASLPAWKQ